MYRYVTVPKHIDKHDFTKLFVYHKAGLCKLNPVDPHSLKAPGFNS